VGTPSMNHISPFVALPGRRSLPNESLQILNRLGNGKLPASRLGLALGELRVSLSRHGLELRTVPTPAILPCLLMVVDPRGVLQRLRRVVRRNAQTRTYRERSVKTDEDVECEGDNEFYFFQSLDTDPDVEAMWEQTPALLYELEGRIHKYTPDFFVTRRDTARPILYEVKPGNFEEPLAARLRSQTTMSVKRAMLAQQAARLETIRALYQRFGLDFIVRFAEEIKRQPRFDNVDDLYRFRFCWVPANKRSRVMSRIFVNHATTARDLIDDGLIAFEPDFLTMIARGDLRVDLDHPIGADSLVTLGPVRA
jgi:hypothetical protein